MNRKKKSAKTAIRHIVVYSTPLFALHQRDGKTEPVMLDATGDMEGQSPVERCIDRHGKLSWVPQNEIKVVDPRLNPFGFQELFKEASK